jgi:ankyrin repeat protein
MAAAEKGQADVVQILLSRGADVNARNARGRTAVMLAKKNGRTEVVKLLKKAK